MTEIYLHATSTTNLFISEATVPSELADFFCNFVRFSEPHCELAGELLCDDGLNELLSEPGDWNKHITNIPWNICNSLLSIKLPKLRDGYTVTINLKILSLA